MTLQEAQEILSAIPIERGLLRLKFLVFLSQKNKYFSGQKANVQWMAEKSQEIKKEKNNKDNKNTSFTLMLLSVERSLRAECFS